MCFTLRVAAISKERSLMESVEEIAMNFGKANDVGTAAMYRPFKKRDRRNIINTIFNADWTNPSRPSKRSADWKSPDDPGETGTHATASKPIAAAITKYYKALFTKKDTSNYTDDTEACLQALRNGDRVLPPANERCAAPITPKDITDTTPFLPTAKSPGPDRIYRINFTKHSQRPSPPS